jgi:hypothetical protein
LRESGTARLEEEVGAWDATLIVTASGWLQAWVQYERFRINEARAEIAQRAVK